MNECLCNDDAFVIYYENDGKSLKELKNRVVSSDWYFRRITLTARWIMESTNKKKINNKQEKYSNYDSIEILKNGVGMAVEQRLVKKTSQYTHEVNLKFLRLFVCGELGKRQKIGLLSKKVGDYCGHLMKWI